MKKSDIQALITGLLHRKGEFAQLTYPYDYAFFLDLPKLQLMLDEAEQVIESRTITLLPPLLKQDIDASHTMASFSLEQQITCITNTLVSLLETPSQGPKLSLLDVRYPAYELEILYRDRIWPVRSAIMDLNCPECSRPRGVSRKMLTEAASGVDANIHIQGEKGRYEVVYSPQAGFITTLEFSLGGYGRHLNVSATLYSGHRIALSACFGSSNSIWIANREGLIIAIQDVLTLVSAINRHFAGVVH